MTPLTVLYLEDVASDADLARRQLARQAPEITLDIAVTLAEALGKLEKNHYDILLSDLLLPDGSGLEALTWIRARELPVAVVILTGSSDHDAAIAALKGGADDYLVKRGPYLERLASTLRAAHARFLSRRAQRSQPLRVLYVEHNAFDIDLLQRHLRDHAPHILLEAVTDAETALERLPQDATTPCPWDALLLDYRLPGIDGLELTKILRSERHLEVPIVLVTGQGSEEVAAQALHLGVDDYLSKHEGYLYEIAAVLEKVDRQARLARERKQLAETSARLSHFIEASPVVLYSLRQREGRFVPLWVSDNIERLFGFPSSEVLSPDWWLEHVHEEDRARVQAALARLLEEERLSYRYRMRTADGRLRWVEDTVRLLRDEQGQPKEVIGAWTDISERVREEELAEVRRAALDAIVANKPLEETLDGIARRIERLTEQMRVSIHLIDPHDGRLHTQAAPSLPTFYNAAVDGLEVREGCGSCGTAAARGETVIVEDIDQHPYWQPYRGITQQAGIRAAWAVPFLDERGKVLGTIGCHYATVRRPSGEELALIEEFARIIALAVSKTRAQERLRQAAAVFESTRDGILITTPEPRILAVNRAWCEITGYSEAEAIGQNPRFLQSGRHDRAFYQAMWASLTTTGHWQGEIWNRRKNGEIFPEWLSISTVLDEKGKPSNYVAVLTDLSQLKAIEHKLEYLAHHDPLTGLPNRLTLQVRLAAALERAHRHHHYRLALLFLDLDRFKNVNDSLGHPTGDMLLVEVATRLRQRLRIEDLLARIGGDEFIVLLEQIASPEQAAHVARSLIEQLQRPLSLPDGQQVYIGLSIGISLYPDDALDATELVQHADAALYQAKQEGRNTYRFHTEALTRSARERLALETRLRHALDKGEFLLHYQPLVDGGGRPFGVEALLRWQPPGEAIVPPGKFIPLAEETGLILPIGRWVLETACQQAAVWREQGVPLETMAVNLSARQFEEAHLVELVEEALARSNLPPTCLKLELTESLLMRDAERSQAILSRLRALGVRIAIDDFGTGYSSLAYLRRFPLDTLKIDQSFVRNLERDDGDRQIAATIAMMAHNLGLTVLAEGVETGEQFELLRALGCNAYQGFHFAPPLSPAECRSWFARCFSST